MDEDIWSGQYYHITNASRIMTLGQRSGVQDREIQAAVKFSSSLILVIDKIGNQTSVRLIYLPARWMDAECVREMEIILVTTRLPSLQLARPYTSTIPWSATTSPCVTYLKAPPVLSGRQKTLSGHGWCNSNEDSGHGSIPDDRLVI